MHKVGNQDHKSELCNFFKGGEWVRQDLTILPPLTWNSKHRLGRAWICSNLSAGIAAFTILPNPYVTLQADELSATSSVDN